MPAKVSVVIPTYNAVGQIEPLLPGITSSSRRARVLVAHSASFDRRVLAHAFAQAGTSPAFWRS